MEDKSNIIEQALDSEEDRLALSMAVADPIRRRLNAELTLKSCGIYPPINLFPDGMDSSVYKTEYIAKTQEQYALDCEEYEKLIAEVLKRT